MAKWGEGDPRWIVEEREDAKNVNNWHWTEKNATEWSKTRIKELLQDLTVENDDYCCQITEISKVDGEATANNRKAKLIFFYEFEIKAEWKGWEHDSDTKYNGNIEIPNLSEENDADELDVTITTSSKQDVAYKIKEFFRKTGTKRIQDRLARYIKELKEEYSKGIVLPTKNAKTAASNASSKPAAKNVMKEEMSKPVTIQSQETSLGVKIKCRKLTDSESFDCEPHDLYRALTDKEFARGFSRSDCSVVAEKNGQFSLFDGNVTGEFLDLVPNEKLVMHWRFRSWPAAHHSVVTLTLQQTEERTQLTLTQTGVPEEDFERTKEGWKRFYWQAMKQTFGWGARLF